MTKFAKKLLCYMLCFIMIASIGSVNVVDAIANVKALYLNSQTTSSISIGWTPVEGARGYRIYRYVLSEGKWKALKTLGKTSYIDYNVTAGEVYYYKVKAYQYVNSKAVFSNSYSNTVKVVLAPQAVKGIYASAVGETSLTLNWSKVKNATGYRIYKYNPSSKKYEALVTTGKTSYKVTNLNSTTAYSFIIRAYRKYGLTTFSANSAVFTVATKVGKLTGFGQNNATENGYTISWNKLGGATGYQIYKYDTTADKWVCVKTTSATSYSVYGSGAANGDMYCARAYIGVNGKYTYGPYTSTLVTYKTPAEPTGLKIEKTSTGVKLSWSSVTGAHGYQVHSYSAKTGSWTIIGTSTATSYSINNLPYTDTYKFAVSSYVNITGKKASSDRCESISVFFDTGKAPSSAELSALEKSGIFGYLYDSEEKCFYTSADPWQRVVGYNEVYDVLAPFSLIDFDTVRLKFDYNDKNWMIQLWKGQYGLLFYGAEVGVYTMPKNRPVEYYDCAKDDEMLRMSMDFVEYKTSLFGESDWQKQFSRPYGYYWWCTGFLPGSRYGKYSTLRLDMRITAKDSIMLDGIVGALKQNGMTYTVNGLDIYFTYK